MDKRTEQPHRLGTENIQDYIGSAKKNGYRASIEQQQTYFEFLK